MSSKPKTTATQQRQEHERKKKQQRYLIIGGIALAALLVLGGVVYSMVQTPTVTSTGAALCSNLQALPDEGREHLKPGQTPTYNTNPPTSGTHNLISLPAGIYDANADITQLVHSLEHGYVIMFYNGLPQDQVNQLINIQRSDPIKTIVAPYPNMPNKVSLVAWAHMQNCDGVNEQVIRSFIAQFRNQGPEQAE